MRLERERPVAVAPDAAWRRLRQVRPRIAVDVDGGPVGAVRRLDLDEDARAASFFVRLRMPDEPGGVAGTTRVEVRPRGQGALLAVTADLTISGPAGEAAARRAGPALVERLAGVLECEPGGVESGRARRRPLLLGGAVAALAATAGSALLVWRRRR